MDLGLHTGGIQPQFAPFGHLGLLGQLHHPIVERVQGFGAQRVGPADERGVIGHFGPVQPTEPAQDQALIHLLFGFLITPLVEMLEDQHTRASPPQVSSVAHAPG